MVMSIRNNRTVIRTVNHELVSEIFDIASPDTESQFSDDTKFLGEIK